MTRRHRHVIDTGPALNFLVTKSEKVLFAAVGSVVHATQAVADEFSRKVREQPLFGAGEERWTKLANAGLIEVIPEERSALADRIASDLTSNPLPKLPSREKDLGEKTVVFHAVFRALRGEETYVIIDDRGGQHLVALAQRYIEVERHKKPSVGAIHLLSTEKILASQLNTPRIPDEAALRALHQKLQTTDRGIRDLEQTGLLKHPNWDLEPRP